MSKIKSSGLDQYGKVKSLNGIGSERVNHWTLTKFEGRLQLLHNAEDNAVKRTETIETTSEMSLCTQACAISLLGM